MKTVCAIALAGVLSGCVTVPPDQLPITNEQREFTYEYAAPAKSKSELFKAARNYFAIAFRDSNRVGRVEDESDGTIIGKAVAPWNLSADMVMIRAIPCASNYSMIFVAKDGKAKLQLNLIEGAVPPCGWALPPKRDYSQVVREFESLSKGLSAAIDGDSAVEKLKNF